MSTFISTASKLKHNLLGKVQVSSDMVAYVYNHNYSGGWGQSNTMKINLHPSPPYTHTLSLSQHHKHTYSILKLKPWREKNWKSFTTIGGAPGRVKHSWLSWLYSRSYSVYEYLNTQIQHCLYCATDFPC